jgi:hypothetical protein
MPNCVPQAEIQPLFQSPLRLYAALWHPIPTSTAMGVAPEGPEQPLAACELAAVERPDSALEHHPPRPSRLTGGRCLPAFTQEARGPDLWGPARGLSSTFGRQD